MSDEKKALQNLEALARQFFEAGAYVAEPLEGVPADDPVADAIRKKAAAFRQAGEDLLTAVETIKGGRQA